MYVSLPFPCLELISRHSDGELLYTLSLLLLDLYVSSTIFERSWWQCWAMFLFFPDTWRREVSSHFDVFRRKRSWYEAIKGISNRNRTSTQTRTSTWTELRETPSTQNRQRSTIKCPNSTTNSRSSRINSCHKHPGCGRYRERRSDPLLPRLEVFGVEKEEGRGTSRD